MTNARPFTIEEECFVLDRLAHGFSPTQIANLLPGRTASVVRDKIKRMRRRSAKLAMREKLTGRICLTCQTRFQSKHKFDRVCPKCERTVNWALR